MAKRGAPTKPKDEMCHYVTISIEPEMWDVMESARHHGGKQIRDRSKEVRRAQEFFYVAMGMMEPPPPDQRTALMDTLIEALAQRRATGVAVKKVAAKRKAS